MIRNAGPVGASARQGAHRKQRSRRIAISGCASIALAGLVAACGSAGAGGYGGQPTQPGAGKQSAAASHGPAVTARKLPGVGMVLVDRTGKTVYSPEQEAHGKILCTGSCLSFWFPVAVASGTQLHAPAGISGTLGTIRRSGGVTQLTFNGRPLYTFRLDQGPGELHGSNFSDQFDGRSFTWQVVAANGSVASTSKSAKPGGGYSYPASGAYGN
jgi:predicted lipoprotein with Yx(FWY)xxD motif